MSERKVVLITGASRNLGAAIARGCAKDGWNVAVHYRRAREQAETLTAGLRSQGTEAIAVQADLADDATSAQRVINEVVDHFGRLDGLVNNAADQTTAPLGDLTDDDWQRMLQANVIATTRLVRAALGALAPGGSVVNVSSVEASSAFPNHAHYAAAKAGLESFTRSLALELGPKGMRANAVAPGLIEREGLEAAWPEGHAWWSSVAPNGRPVTADEVAAAVAFLVGDQASGINGVVLPVDGGWSASARTTF
ncbi:MAG: SDR family oxidoreductase [Actinomycetota bacterium]|nr:SDR family oxidoreductase [Actinomycetota bacterium]